MKCSSIAMWIYSTKLKGFIIECVLTEYWQAHATSLTKVLFNYYFLPHRRFGYGVSVLGGFLYYVVICCLQYFKSILYLYLYMYIDEEQKCRYESLKTLEYAEVRSGRCYRSGIECLKLTKRNTFYSSQSCESLKYDCLR